jgi:two-component system NarL family response regulator
VSIHAPLPTNVIRTLVVDDHRLVLEGLQFIINRDPGLNVVAVATNGAEAIDAFKESRPDITLMDLQLPGVSGLEAIKGIKAADPGARIIVLTTYQGDEDIYRALHAGANAYLLKDTVSKDLVRCIYEVYEGGRQLEPEIRAALAERASRPALTVREVEVLRLVAKGLRNKEIAAVLNIANETVQSHVKSIFIKLEVSDRTAAMNTALQRGIIHLTD